MVLPTYANLRTNQAPQPHILEGCRSLGSFASENSFSDPEFGVVPDRYTFHCNDEIYDSQYYFCHRLHAQEIAQARNDGDGKHPIRNFEDIVQVIYSDMRADGLPFLRLKMLKKTHSRWPMTTARLQFKRVKDCFHMLGKYHKMDTYRAFAADGHLLVGRPIPGSATCEGGWKVRHAGADIALR